jgi:hypothetical protein
MNMLPLPTGNCCAPDTFPSLDKGREVAYSCKKTGKADIWISRGWSFEQRGVDGSMLEEV